MDPPSPGRSLPDTPSPTTAVRPALLSCIGAGACSASFGLRCCYRLSSVNTRYSKTEIESKTQAAAGVDHLVCKPSWAHIAPGARHGCAAVVAAPSRAGRGQAGPRVPSSCAAFPSLNTTTQTAPAELAEGQGIGNRFCQRLQNSLKSPHFSSSTMAGRSEG